MTTISKFKKLNNRSLPEERQMLYILQNFTRIQEELVKSKRRIAELEEGELAWQNGQLRLRLEKGQYKYDRLKDAYKKLLVKNNRRKAIMESVWDIIPDDIKQKFEKSDTSKFEDLLDDIDNENVVLI